MVWIVNQLGSITVIMLPGMVVIAGCRSRCGGQLDSAASARPCKWYPLRNESTVGTPERTMLNGKAAMSDEPPYRGVAYRSFVGF